MRQLPHAWSVLACLSVAATFASESSHAAPNCPAPTKAQGRQCALRTDAALTDTIWLESGTHLNCQGHRLTPATAGVLDNPATAVNEFQPSTPELALIVDQSYDVKIQNCVIVGFDFGIIVARSKAAGAPGPPGQSRNKILGNTIDVRTNAIDLIRSDNVLVSDNRITFASERGRGIVVDYDSDGNEIRNNAVTSTDDASTGQVRQLPLGPFVISTTIMDNEIHTLQSDKPLQNFVVSGVLFQLPSEDSVAGIGSSDDNLIEANDVVDRGVGWTCTVDPGTACRDNSQCTGKGVCLQKQNSGISFNTRAFNGIVRGNRVTGQSERGISFGGNTAVTTLAGAHIGRCSLNATRLCSTNSDCLIPGFDAVSQGTCVGAGPLTFNANSFGLIAEDNVLYGTFDTGALFANNSDQFAFRGNTIVGGAAGIRITGATNGLIERNVVSGAIEALLLTFQSPFTHVTRLNDFTNYTVAIRTSNDFNTPTDISGDRGNYWGLPCPGFDPGLVLRDNGTVNPNVFDGKPYGEPVARTPPNELPAVCFGAQRFRTSPGESTPDK